MDLPDRSGKQPAKKEIKQVVTGARTVQQPATKRLMGHLVQESPKNVGSKIVANVIVPRFKAGVEAAFNEFMAGILWGAGSRPPSTLIQQSGLRPPTGINYHGITSATGAAALPSQQRKTNGPYENVIVNTEEQATLALANLYDLINQYRVVTVADLYESVGITPETYHGGLGWHSLDGARISKVRDGFVVELPLPKSI